MVPISKNGYVQQDFLLLVSFEEAQSVDAVVSGESQSVGAVVVGGSAGGACDGKEQDQVVRVGRAGVRSDGEVDVLGFEENDLLVEAVVMDGSPSSLSGDTSSMAQDSLPSVVVERCCDKAVVSAADAGAGRGALAVREETKVSTKKPQKGMTTLHTS